MASTTTGNNYFTKSMNSIIEIDDGAGTTISDGNINCNTFTTIDFNTDNLTCDNATITTLNSSTINNTGTTTTGILETNNIETKLDTEELTITAKIVNFIGTQPNTRMFLSKYSDNHILAGTNNNTAYFDFYSYEFGDKRDGQIRCVGGSSTTIDQGNLNMNFGTVAINAATTIPTLNSTTISNSGTTTTGTLASTTINNSGTTTTGTLASTTINNSGTTTTGTLASTTINNSGTATTGTLASTTINNSGTTTSNILNASTSGTIPTLNSTTGNITTLNSTTINNSGTTTSNILNASTSGTIPTFNSTTGNITTLNSTTINNSGTTTSNILNASTSGTIPTFNSTTGNITTLNSTTINNSGTTTSNILNASTSGTIPTFNSTTGNITTLNSTTIDNSGTTTTNTLNTNTIEPQTITSATNICTTSTSDINIGGASSTTNIQGTFKLYSNLFRYIPWTTYYNSTTGTDLSAVISVPTGSTMPTSNNARSLNMSYSVIGNTAYIRFHFYQQLGGTSGNSIYLYRTALFGTGLLIDASNIYASTTPTNNGTRIGSGAIKLFGPTVTTASNLTGVFLVSYNSSYYYMIWIESTAVNPPHSNSTVSYANAGLYVDFDVSVPLSP